MNPSRDRRESSWQNTLSHWINRPSVDFCIALLILLSVVIITTEAVTPRNSPWRLRLDALGDLITWVFVVELSLRFAAERRKKKFFSKWWLDCLAVMPLLRPLRFLRVLRLLRLFRVAVIMNRRSRRVADVFRQGYAEMLTVLLLITVIVLVGAVGIATAEGPRNPDFDSFGKALWWSFFSLAAGEPIPSCPETTAGKVIALVVIFGGLTVFAMFTGVVSAFMVQRLRNSMEVKALDLEELNDHILICGWNRAGHRIVEEFQGDPLHSSRPVVIIAERDTEPVLDYRAVRRDLIFFIAGDYTQVEVLQKARVETASVAILLADKSRDRSDQDRDARTVLAALIIEKMNKQCFTCVELLNRDNETHLKLAGVEEVVVGDEYAGNIIASDARSQGGIVHLVNELFTNKYGNEFFKLPVPEDWVGRPLVDLHCQLKRDHNAILVAVDSLSQQRVIVNPPADYPFGEGDQLLLIATDRPF